MVRLAEQFNHDTPMDMCLKIQEATGERLGVIDVVLWRYCNLNGSIGKFDSQSKVNTMDEWMTEQLEQEKKDREVLNQVKLIATDEYFKNIELELDESEHPSNYRIVNEPVGDFQKSDELDTWVNQNTGGGVSGDSWAGTMCVLLPDGKYLMWDYWM